MKQQCRDAVNAHLATQGIKPLTDAQVKRMDVDMHNAAKVLARRDRAGWSAMTPEERTIAAAKFTRDSEIDAANASAVSKSQTAARLSTNLTRLNEFVSKRADRPGKWSKGVIDLLEAVDNSVQGAMLSATRGFGEIMSHVKDGSVFDFSSTKTNAFFADVVREVYGVDTGNQWAKRFADKWTPTMDGYRQARNRFGGLVGKLPHYVPQVHNATIMQRVGEDSWVSFMMKNVDRSQYMDEAGELINDAAMETQVRGWFRTIVTDGNNKIKLNDKGLAEDIRTGGGGSNIAKALNEKHREIHLKDAEAVIAYNAQFHDKSLGSIFFDHMQGNARDVALMQELGPNPELTYTTLRETAKAKDTAMKGAKFDKDGNVKGATRAGFTPDAYYRQLLGHTESTTLDVISGHLSAWQAATKLTSTALRAPFQDMPGVLLNMADVGQIKNIGTIMRTAFNRKEAERFGIGAEIGAMVAKQGNLRVLSQGRLYAGNAISRYAQATMKYTGLEAWTNAARSMGQTSHALALADWAKLPWDKLDDSQRGLLHNSGIMESDWVSIQKLPKHKLKDVDIFDISGVHGLGLTDDDAMLLQSRMLGFVRMGGDIVTSEHNLTAQTIMSLGGRTNALTRQTMMFKAAGSNQTAHMLDRLSRKTTGGKIKYIGATAAMGASFGYMALCAQAIVAGQRPPEITDWRTLAKAISVSGGFAMFQDMVQSAADAMNPSFSGHSSSIIPLFGDMATIGQIAAKAASGETDKAGYMAVKFGRGLIAPLNYWYAKAAVDHLFFNDAAEALNPGYNDRLNKRAGQIGQQYFWDPRGGFASGPGITGKYEKPLGE